MVTLNTPQHGTRQIMLGGQPLQAADIESNHVVVCAYDGGAFNVVRTYRPPNGSRGWRRHVRRRKAAERRL